MWDLDSTKGCVQKKKERKKKTKCCVPKNWCFSIVVLERTLESPLERKEIQLVNPKGNQPWKFIGKTDAEVPRFWQPNVKSWLIAKDPDAGKVWGHEEKRATEDELIGYHQLKEYEFEQTLGDSEEQGSLACYSPLAAVTAMVILKPKKRKSVTVSIAFPSICHEVMGPDAMILLFLMLSFKPSFHSPLSLSSRGSLVPHHFLP